MLQYSAIIRELLVAQKALENAATLLEEDNTHLNDAGALLGDLAFLKMSLETQEAEEDEG